MTLYTRPHMTGIYGTAAFALPDGRQFPASWWRTASEQEIADEGFVAYEPPDPEPPTPDQIIEGFRVAIQAHVDAAAVSRLYDGGNSLATYVSSTNPQWAAEAVAFVAWRDAVWAYSYTELDKVLAGQRDQPTIEAFIGELPPILWP